MVSCGASLENDSADSGSAVKNKAVTTPVVQRYADGQWNHYVIQQGPNGMRIYVYYWSVFVDAKVQNLAYNKKMGLIWTVNNWTNNNVTYGSYKGSLGGGFEKWGLNLGEWDSRSVSTLKYCIFVEMNGQKYYDNNYTSNYTINFHF